MRHINIPIFIPHLGCPNQCVFCNQRSISGVSEFHPEDVIPIIEESLLTVEDDAIVEIAFFGGSFTGIDRELMISLLEIANSYISAGRVQSLRCSTRPDYIDSEIVGILKKYNVRTVELGLQSSSESVLEISKRGHNFEAELKACKIIVESGISLVGQMMIGLPGSTLESELETARFIVASGASAARIYPTVVFRETELCDMALSGIYQPLSLDDAIWRSARVLEVFIDSGVDVIRIGLQASENLSGEDKYLAGPNHPSLGELVIGEVYYNKICKMLSDKQLSGDENIKVCVSRGALSKAIGQHKRNRIRLAERYKNISFAEDDSIPEYGILLEIKNGEIKCI